ncbi:HAD family hydrolase [Coprobacter secundus]|jgi:hypothetical protein|uniref:HAD family hydrolase n=1 Tax=Coprobacter secundus TaxID=1501392 RepID=UPI0005740AC6|nr:HAD family hydrolase [Coprobacter secundus]KHM48213.1 HAD family hydrolase [Coprobacter secundus]
MKKYINTILFDADDTLWENEIFFRQTEQEFCLLLEKFGSKEVILKTLLKSEIGTLPIYGFGIKGFMLSMIDTALQLGGENLKSNIISRIMELGKEQLRRPVKVYEGVEDVLNSLQYSYRLILATKGDPTDQKRKIEASGLKPYFSHIEIMPDKTTRNYEELLKNIDCCPNEIIMVGNSVKSDILPILQLGGRGIYIPCHTTWIHETAECPQESPYFKQIQNFTQIPEILQTMTELNHKSA